MSESHLKNTTTNMFSIALTCLLLAVVHSTIECDAAFVSPSRSLTSSTLRVPWSCFAPCDRRFGMTTSSDDDLDMDEDDDEVEPGKMRVSEIKSELAMRGIGFADCFDKEALVERLEEARATGKADPRILEDFNKKKVTVSLF